MSLEGDRNIDLRIAAVLNKVADQLKQGTLILDETKPEPAIAAAVAVLPKKQRTAKIEEPAKPKRSWTNEILYSVKDPEQTNFYRILFAEFGQKEFDLRTFTGNRPEKKLFKPHPSHQRVLKEMQRLEAVGAARALDDLRLRWILEKV